MQETCSHATYHTKVLAGILYVELKTNPIEVTHCTDTSFSALQL